MVICVDVVVRRAPSLAACKMRRRYRDVWYSPLRRRGFTCFLNCLEGLVNAWVTPRSSADRDVRGVSWTGSSYVGAGVRCAAEAACGGGLMSVSECEFAIV